MIDFVLHFDKHLLDFVHAYGSWVYGLLFAIVFAETGFVVTPILPGDSLLFAVAAFLGNAANYTIGRFVGPRVFSAEDSTSGISQRLLNREHLAKAHAFFEEYGGKAVVLSRFMPIVRTFLPFVAGAAAMKPSEFGFYNAIGAIGWVTLCLGAGFFFGNIPIIKQNFSLVTIGIVIVSVLPMAIEYLRRRSRPKPDTTYSR